MTAREKVVIVFAGIIVVGGAGSFIQSRITHPTESTESSSAVLHKDFVASSRQQIAACQLTPSERYVLDMAQSEWAARPSSPRGVQQPAEPEQTAPLAFAYTGFVNTGSELFAIINGHEYRSGDALQDGAGLVEVIKSGHVVILLDDGSKRETVPFQKNALKGE